MADYNLSGLTTRTFEKLVQALAVKYLGPAVTVFGDGPDGGREATFEGRVLDKRVDWDGYVVIQAKFRQRTSGAEDQDWALAELKKELDTYAAKPQRRRPKYYIFATNVVLTPVQDSGGKDRARELFDEHAPALGIEDLWLWDYDQLGAFLDDAADIRLAYAAFITSGDVLAAALDSFEGTPDFKLVITNYIAKELLAAQFAKLEEAGYAGEDRIPLSRVFIDLPVGDSPKLEPDREEKGVSTFASTVLTHAGERFDPESLARAREMWGRVGEGFGRIMLIGGPGQGKSTIGQFVCQLFRAALLMTVPTWSLPNDVLKVLKAIESTCSEDSLPLPAARRFPVQIILGEFAVAISRRNAAIKNGSETQPLTLLQFLADKVGARTGMMVSAALFRKWLARYPWVLILDGLDEVPSSSNRDAVLSCISDFWVDANQQNADLLVIATTRPQGYGSEFSAMNFKHLWLLPLSPTRALGYAEKLLAARYGDDVDRREKVVGRLREATQLDATARLMRSPLQVTIMSTLLDQIGKAPQDRWRLFYEYYQTIYRREMERDTPTAPLLSRFRSDIDTLHYSVAWELQVESEQSGGTDARLPADRFREILRSKLIEKGFEPSDFTVLEAQLLEAVENRLVFLVSPQAGQVGFEIRSLQEFMAAQYLMNGGTREVQTRLRAIAPASAWRNVFLFAAGRCFSLDEHLRDTVHTICVDLNHDLGGRVGAAIKAGSSLALDLLEDGLADRQPKYARLLAACALELLDLPFMSEQRQLAEVWSQRLDGLYREALTTRLTANGAHRGAWVLLLALQESGIDWVSQLSEEHKPGTTAAADELLDFVSYGQVSNWIRDVFLTNVVSTARVTRFTYHLHQDMLRSVLTPAWLRPLLAQLFTADDAMPSVRINNGESGVVSVTLPSLVAAKSEPRWDAWLDAPNNDAWQWLRRSAEFAIAPSVERLLAFCNAVVNADQRNVRWWMPPITPWPLQAMAQLLEHVDIAEIRRLIESGVLGEHDDWIRAEGRWLTAGIQLSDLTRRSSLVPFEPTAANGIPLSLRVSEVRNGAAIRTLARVVSKANDAIVRSQLATWAIDLLNVWNHSLTEGDIDDIEVLLSAYPDTKGFLIMSFVEHMPFLSDEEERMIAFLDRVGQRQNLWVHEHSKRLDMILANAIKRGAVGVGVRHLIALIAAGRGRYRGFEGAALSVAEYGRVNPMISPMSGMEQQAEAVLKCACNAGGQSEVVAGRVIAMAPTLQRQTMQMCLEATIDNETVPPDVEAFHLSVWERTLDGESKAAAGAALREVFRRRRAEL